MANTIRSEGKLIVPMDTYLTWLTSQLNPQPGTFVAFGPTVFLDDRLETEFATATDFQPSPPTAT
jgi:hypothetical protein